MFDAFSEALVKVLQSALEACTMPKRREICRHDMPVYKTRHSPFGMRLTLSKSRLFEGLMNEFVFERLVKDLFKIHEHPPSSINTVQRMNVSMCVDM